jgi:hypothetical protein
MHGIERRIRKLELLTQIAVRSMCDSSEVARQLKEAGAAA